MKKSVFIKLMSVACLVLLMASCNKVPKYAKMIPDDASVVIRMDVKKASENGKLGDNSTLKDKIVKAMKDADMSRSARDEIEEIIDDPTKSGIDFSDPLMFYVTQGDDNSENGGLLGTIKDKDDFTEFLNALSKEGDGDGVEDAKKDFSYIMIGNNTGLFYNKDFFLLTDISYDKDKQEDDIDDIKKEFEKDKSSHSMADNPDMKTMCKKDGIMQVLIEGKGLAEQKGFSDEFEEGLPSDVKLDDFAYLIDFNTEAGDATLTGEIISNSDGWKNYIAKYDQTLGNLGTGLNNYMSADGACAMVNVNGDKLYDLLKDFGYTKKMNDSADGKTFLKILRSINGDVVFNMSSFDFSDYKKVDGGLYITSDNNSIVNEMKDEVKNQPGFESTGNDRYAVPLGGGGYTDEYGNTVTTPSTDFYLNFGYKSGVSYFAFNNKKDKVAEAKNALQSSLYNGKKCYVYLSSELLKPAKESAEKSMKEAESQGYSTASSKAGVKVLKTIIEDVAYIEAYYEGGGKSTIRLVMKDSKVDPLSVFMDIIADDGENLFDIGFGNSNNVAAVADTDFVDSVAVDSTAGYDDYNSYEDNSYDEYGGGDDYDYAEADTAAAY